MAVDSRYDAVIDVARLAAASLSPDEAQEALGIEPAELHQLASGYDFNDGRYRSFPAMLGVADRNDRREMILAINRKIIEMVRKEFGLQQKALSRETQFRLLRDDDVLSPSEVRKAFRESLSAYQGSLEI